MLRKEFQCEIVTPIFQGGAKNGPLDEPELRSPSIRGAVRWWFRAMMGGIIGNNLEELKRLESVVFGSNENSSAISVRIKQDDLTTKDHFPLPHKENLFKKEAFNPKQKVNITLKLNPWTIENKEEIFNAAVESLKLLLTFGGLGNRSRRGFGSLHWRQNAKEEKTEKEILDEEKIVFEDLYEIENAKKAITKNACRSTLPEFPCIIENFFSIYEANNKNTWYEDLKSLMEKMSEFKAPSHINKDATGWVKGKQRQASPPIVHSKRSGDKTKLLFSYFKCKMNNV